jgi:hypothetical protein
MMPEENVGETSSFAAISGEWCWKLTTHALTARWEAVWRFLVTDLTGSSTKTPWASGISRKGLVL